MEKIQNLLNQIKIISKKNAEILDATGGRFNMFQVCGVNHYENTHSAIIAEFLNPNGTHGLKSKLLECFIETLGEYFTINTFNCEKSRVRTEHSTEEGRIDILLEDNLNKAVIIENKIYANDQPEQLKRYNRYAQTYKSGYQILYLTLFGDNASEQSGEGISYLSISYKENIINWLEKCVAIASRYPIVRETIIQYINHLKQLTNQDMDTKNKDEITEVLSRIENLRAAQVIFKNYSATYNYIIEKHFNPKMEEFAKQKGLEYHFEKSEELYVKFHFTNSSWLGKLWIGFTFEGNRCHYGLCNNPNIYRISDENRKIIHEHLNKLGINSRKESNWWPFYAHFTNLSLDTWESEIIKSDIFLNDCKEKIEKLLNAMVGIEI
ncbi:PD-(D/E)XK nuclease family protein [Flavobacterium sp.]|uniref:PDDEXK-like family protein n=1 Tax=Flavobacterium sp. TaxID=239 RepID=UPI002625F98F|nr:PD-(D/E)XK nuclease family protein [Flavobacterium sp.]